MPHFGPNIIVDGSAVGADSARYENEVLQQLTQLMMFRTGQAVIAEIRARTRRRLRIVPWRRRSHNAEATPVSWRDATAAGALLRDGADGHHEAGWGVGTGRGSDSVIHYTPFIFASDMGGWSDRTRSTWVEVTGQLPPRPGDERGELLLHEMMHSLQHMSGSLTNAPMPAQDTVSEFNAIVVTNIYSWERSRLARSSHHGFQPAHNPTGILANPQLAPRLNELRKGQPGLVARLATIESEVNPFYAPRPAAGVAAGASH